jgi:ZIP family zinc transporter
MDWGLIATATGASAAAGLATGVGALPVLAIRKISDRVEAAFLGFAAGVMLAASFFSLILPGLEAAAENGNSKAWSAGIIGLSILLGAGTLQLLNARVPHEHFIIGPQAGASQSKLQRIWLFVIAITLHNFPEGLAVGTSFGGGNMANGTATALGIGLQNIPEGLAVAVSLAFGRLQPGLLLPRSARDGPGRAGRRLPRHRRRHLFLGPAPLGPRLCGGSDDLGGEFEIIPETHVNGRRDSATAA